MEQMMYIVAYFFEVFKMMTALKLVYQKSTERWKVLLLGCGLYIALIVFAGHHLNYYFYLFAWPIVILTVLFSYKDRFWDNIKKILLIQLFLNAIDTSAKYVLNGFQFTKNLSEIQMAALKSGVSLTILLILFAFVWGVNLLLLKGKFNQFKINKNLPYVAAFLLFAQTLVVEWLHSMRKYVLDTPKFDRINFISTIGYAVIAVIMWIVLYADRINNSLNDVYEIEKQMGEMKEQHYRMLLQKEEETRSYRHDMMNHFICLDQLIEEGDLEAAKSYLNQLIGGLKTIQGKNIVVGNSTAEVLLNYYVSLLPKDITVDVIGLVPEKIGIADAQLSTVLGNTLSNATDELMRLKKGKLRVEFKDGNKFLCMKVVNSVGEKKYIDENQRVATSKQDKKNHGFGIKNTQEIISKIGGKLELACTEEEFITTIYLKK